MLWYNLREHIFGVGWGSWLERINKDKREEWTIVGYPKNRSIVNGSENRNAKYEADVWISYNVHYIALKNITPIFWSPQACKSTYTFNFLLLKINWWSSIRHARMCISSICPLSVCARVARSPFAQKKWSEYGAFWLLLFWYACAVVHRDWSRGEGDELHLYCGGQSKEDTHS